MGSKSQRKGASGERELAGILRDHGYAESERGGSMTFGSVPDVVGLPGIHIEVKRVEKLNVMEAMEQSIRDSEVMKDGTPALFHRRNRKPWLVTMRLDDWLRLYGHSVVTDPNASFTAHDKANSQSRRQHDVKEDPNDPR